MDLYRIATDEMISDYHESLMDKETCERLRPTAQIAYNTATHDGIALKHATRTLAHLDGRIEGNTAIMEVIEEELERRGEQHLITP